MLTVHDCEQGSPEWFALRLGLPTSSMFSAILAKGEGKTRRAYLHRLAAEIITGEIGESFQSPAMERGKIMEEEARSLYSFIHDAPLTRVGFITNGQKGCSPDSLIGDDGGLEIKTQRADLLIDTLLKDEIPSEHRAQVQGNLWVSEREWWDLVVYWPKMPLFVKRVYRDEVYIAALALEVARFNAELSDTVARLRQYDGEKAA